MYKVIKLIAHIAATFFFLGVTGNPAHAGFESGVDAFNRGDFKTGLFAR